MAQLGPRAAYGLTKAAPKSKPRSTGASGPRSEAAAGSGYGIARAEKFKRTAPYRGAVRAAYDAQPVATRSARQRQIEARNPAVAKAIYGLNMHDSGPRNHVDLASAVRKMRPEDLNLLRTHIPRMQRNAVLAADAARSPRMSTQDRTRATRFAATTAYHDILTDLRTHQTPGAATSDRIYGQEQATALRNQDPLGAMGASARSQDAKAPRTNYVVGVNSTARDVATVKAAQQLATAGYASPEVLKALRGLDTRHQSAASTLLRQTTRPISAIAAGVRAYGKSGGNSTQAFQGAVHGFVHNDDSFTKMLADAKAPAAVTVLGGLALDVALDPTTYLTLGAGAEAKTAAKIAQSSALRAGADETQALAVARKVYDHNFNKAAGVKVGFRGLPVRAASMGKQVLNGKGLRDAYDLSTREISTSGKLTSKIASRTPLMPKGRVYEPTTLGARGRDFLGRQIVANYRPRTVHPVDHAHILDIGRRLRAGLGRADRVSRHRGTAYQQYVNEHGLTEHDQWHVIRAVERDSKDGLSEPQSHLFDVIKRDNADLAQMDVEAGIRDPHHLINDTATPQGPLDALDHTGQHGSPADVLAHIDHVQTTALGRYEMAKLQHAEAQQHLGDTIAGQRDFMRAQGRAEIVSRAVGDVRGERRAERTGNAYLRELERKAKTKGTPAEVLADTQKRSDKLDALNQTENYAAGGHGVHQAWQKLDGASVRAARKAERDAYDAMLRTRKEARAERLAHRKAVKAQAAHAHAPKGYFPHMPSNLLDPARLESETLHVSAASAGQRVSGDSLHHRSNTAALEHRGQRAADFVTTNVAAPMSRRTGETLRGIELASFHNRLAALGHKVDNPSGDGHFLPANEAELPHDLRAVYINDGRGFKPAMPPSSKPDGVALREAQHTINVSLRAGHDVRVIDPHVYNLAWEHAMRGRRGRGHDSSFLRGVDKTQGRLKTAQTVINPGYHFTNLLGDSFNARLGGATALDVVAARRMLRREYDLEHHDASLAHGLTATHERSFGSTNKVARAILGKQSVGEGKVEFYKGLGGHASDAEVVDLAREWGGVQMGMSGAELHQLQQIAYGASSGKQFMEWLRGKNELREDLMRFASFRGALKRGMNPRESADHANAVHFDYGNLTQTESDVLRRIIPFYTFASRNAALQARMFVRSPGRYATVQKVRDNLSQAGGLPRDWADKMPGYLQGQAPFAIPGVTTDGLPVAANLKLPLTDLNLINPTQWSNEFGNRLSTLIRMPMEQWQQYSFFFQDKIRNKLVPAPSWAMNPVIRNMIESIDYVPFVGKPKITHMQDRRTGKMVPAWSWRLDQFIKMIPLASTLAGATTPGRDQHHRGLLGFAGYALGPRPYAVDPQDGAVAHLYQDLDRLTAERDQLKPTVHHAAGTPWHGKIGRLNREIGKTEHKLNVATTNRGDAVPVFEPPKRKSAGGVKLGTGGKTKRYGLGGGFKP